MSELHMVELFAGYGGLGLGVTGALARLGVGVETVAVCDIEPGPCAILAHHWPDVPNLGDVTAVDWSDLVGRVDIIAGGFPCQDVSTAGRQAGLAPGTRSGLWAEFARAIEVLRPGLVVIENVRGLLSAPATRGGSDAVVECCPVCMDDGDGGDLRALGAVLGDLAGLGFDAEWGMLAAAAVGAAHRRERVFIVAWPSADASGGESERRRVVRDLGGAAAAHERACRERQRFRDAPRDRGAAARLMPPPTASEDGGVWHADSKEGSPNLRTVAAMLPPPTMAPTTGNGHAREAPLGGRRPGSYGAYEDAVVRWEQVLGRPAPEPTEPGPNGGRRLSAYAVEFLMGLPEGHVTGVPIKRPAQLRLQGNGVVPQQAAAAVSALLARAFNNDDALAA